MSPHALHRQYDDESTFALAVVMSDDSQNGHAVGVQDTSGAG